MPFTLYKHSEISNLLNDISKLNPDMILVDLDDTIMTNSYYACSSSWFENFLTKYGIDKKPLIKNLKMCGDLNKYQPVLSELNHWLIKQSEDKPLIGLTNRDISFKDMSFNQSSALGIQFLQIKNEDEFKYDEKSVLFNGIIFCGYEGKSNNYEESKGIILEHFIKFVVNNTSNKLDEEYNLQKEQILDSDNKNLDKLKSLSVVNSILFIDDLIENIQMVKIACDKLNIHCHAVHLTTVEDALKNEDPYSLEVIGCIQDYSMKNCKVIPNTEELLFKNAVFSGFSPNEISLYYT